MEEDKEKARQKCYIKKKMRMRGEGEEGEVVKKQKRRRNGRRVREKTGRGGRNDKG